MAWGLVDRDLVGDAGVARLGLDVVRDVIDYSLRLWVFFEIGVAGLTARVGGDSCVAIVMRDPELARTGHLVYIARGSVVGDDAVSPGGYVELVFVVTVAVLVGPYEG